MSGFRTHALLLQVCLWSALIVVTAAQAKIPPVQVTAPGDTGRRITEDGLLANYFPAARNAPAVMFLPGSLGGLPPEINRMATTLQSEGFSTLHLSYFRGPGQSARLELLPLEYFATALAWLKRQPEVDPSRIAIMGLSKGAEGALLVAVRHPELKAVIAAMPSSAVWRGATWEDSASPIDSSWSEGRRAVPYLPLARYDGRKWATMTEQYTASLAALPQHPEAAIPVERISGRVMLICGEADTTWPSCPMARQIERRLREHRRPAATLLAYPNAGHAVVGLPMPLDDPRLTSGGGTPQGASVARADSWSKVVAFLKTSL